MQGMQAWLADAKASGTEKGYSSIVPGWASLQEGLQQSLQELLAPCTLVPSNGEPPSDSDRPAASQAAEAACEAALRTVQLWAQGVHAASRTHYSCRLCGHECPPTACVQQRMPWMCMSHFFMQLTPGALTMECCIQSRLTMSWCGHGCAGVQSEANEDKTISITQVQQCLDVSGSSARLGSALASSTRLLASLVQTSEQQSGEREHLQAAQACSAGGCGDGWHNNDHSRHGSECSAPAHICRDTDTARPVKQHPCWTCTAMHQHTSTGISPSQQRPANQGQLGDLPCTLQAFSSSQACGTGCWQSAPCWT